MPIKLTKEIEKQLIVSIKRYVEENHEEQIGDLKASLLLDFCLKEIGPCIYNVAIEDAQAHLADKVEDMGAICYQEEFLYWDKK